MITVGLNSENLFTQRIHAGKRTYFFDVKTTKSNNDYYIIITESRRLNNDKFEKHKLFLYQQDFKKFLNALSETVNHIEQKKVIEAEKAIQA